MKFAIRAILGQLLNLVYGYPTRDMKVIGITGTEGKTSTATIMYELLKAHGKKVGMINTIEAVIDGERVPTGLHVTTPDQKDLYKLLSKMKKSGVEIVILETTSHALDQNRIGGIKYDCAVYTNIAWEHMDYHKNYESYLKAKARLIGKVKNNGVVILNKDDKSYEPLLGYVNVRQQLHKVEYSLGEHKDADLLVCDIKDSNSIDSIEFDINGHGHFKLGLSGRYNISNALAAIGGCIGVNLVDWEKVRQVLASIMPDRIKGRWNIIQREPFIVINDFAHSPNAFENMLSTAKKSAKKRVIIVFGSAGRRDKEKRPVIGQIAANYADIIILTADDPRDEKVADINSEIERGVLDVWQDNRNNGKEYYIIEDRGQAIEKAISLAKEDDIVIVAGKGHEQSLAIQDERGNIVEKAWDDEKVIKKILNDISLKKE